PVRFSRRDPVEGEITKPLYIVPPVTANLSDPAFVFGSNEPKEIKVSAEAFQKNISGKLLLDVPEGWKVEPAFYAFDFRMKRETKDFYFQVYPPSNPGAGKIRAII